jgi:hypothetical protein
MKRRVVLRTTGGSKIGYNAFDHDVSLLGHTLNSGEVGATNLKNSVSLIFPLSRRCSCSCGSEERVFWEQNSSTAFSRAYTVFSVAVAMYGRDFGCAK